MVPQLAANLGMFPDATALSSATLGVMSQSVVVVLPGQAIQRRGGGGAYKGTMSIVDRSPAKVDNNEIIIKLAEAFVKRVLI